MLDSLESQIRRECLRSLYRICGRHALLPRSLAILPHYDPMETPLYRGGFADVWKGEYDGQEVAVKVLKVSRASDFGQIRKVGCPRIVAWISELTVSRRHSAGRL